MPTEPTSIGQVIARGVPTGLAPGSTPNPTSSAPSASSDPNGRIRGQLWDTFRKSGAPLRHRKRFGEGKEGLNLSQLAGRWLIEDSPAEYAEKRERAFKALQSDGGSVLIVGPRGTGKTQLALELVARMCLDCLLPEPKEMAHVMGVRPFIAYWVFEELLAAEKASWQQKSGILEEPLKNAGLCELLILDEVQERGEGAWEDRQFTVLFDKRYREMRRTIMVANLEPGALDGRLPASILSRMSEIGVVVECRWPSFRGAR